MKQQKGAGYTITELMIVLTVSGVIAVSAFTMIRGQQGKNEFTQAVRDFETKLNDIANDVTKGYFPNKGLNNECTSSNSGIDFSLGIGTVEQGASNDCVFAGKVLQFNSPDPDGDGKIKVFTLASRRADRSGNEIQQLSQLAAGDLEFMPNSEESFPLTYGLRVRPITGATGGIRANGGVAVWSIAFLTSFARQESGGSLTGAPETELRWLQNSTEFESLPSLNARVSNPANYRPVPPSTATVAFCLEHAAGGRRARVSLGNADGGALTIRTEMDVAC